MNSILTDYNKIIGCKEMISYHSNILNMEIQGKCGDISNNKLQLCPSCSKAKEVFLQRCQSELKDKEDKIRRIRHNSRYEVGCKDEFNNLLSDFDKEILNLKEVLEKK